MGFPLSLPTCFAARDSWRLRTRSCSTIVHEEGSLKEGHIEASRVAIGKARVEVGDVSTTELMDPLLEVTQACDDLGEKVSHRWRIRLVVVVMKVEDVMMKT